MWLGGRVCYQGARCCAAPAMTSDRRSRVKAGHCQAGAVVVGVRRRRSANRKRITLRRGAGALVRRVVGPADTRDQNIAGRRDARRTDRQRDEPATAQPYYTAPRTGPGRTEIALSRDSGGRRRGDSHFPLMLTAWGDESGSQPNRDPDTYLIAAALCDDDDRSRSRTSCVARWSNPRSAIPPAWRNSQVRSTCDRFDPETTRATGLVVRAPPRWGGFTLDIPLTEVSVPARR